MPPSATTVAHRHPTAHRHPALRRIGSAVGWIVVRLGPPALTAVAAFAATHTGWTGLAFLAGAAAYLTGYTAAAYQCRERLHREVAQARTDPLTGLPNRAIADALLDQATRAGTPMTVALVDVDGLHIVNGNFGHAAGDQYLTTVARRLRRAVPASGVLVRQGGDEFTLLVPGTDAPGTDPDRLAADITAALTGPALIAGHRIQPRVSVGIATTHQTHHQTGRQAGDQIGQRSGVVDAQHARARADSALYTAKLYGGHQILVFDDDRDPEPSPDATRPLLRRRDLTPASGTGLAWLPTPDDELIPLLLSLAEVRTVHDALATARGRWAQAATEAGIAEADTGTRRPASPASSRPDRLDIEPTPAGYASIAHLATDQQARHSRLLERLDPIIDTADALDDTGHTPAEALPAASVVLIGISAAFTATDLEALVITAAEAVHGQPEDLSSRQRELADRAYSLLHDPSRTEPINTESIDTED
jgi:diguanylate cyclase (GGDEF)-like protein